MVMRWSVLVGVFAAALGAVEIGIAVLAYFDPDHGTFGYGDMVFTATGAVALLLSYPLIRGQNWARVSLVAVLSVCWVALALLIPFSFIANHWIYTRLAIVMGSASTLCAIIFFILVLLHPDVRRAFHSNV